MTTYRLNALTGTHPADYLAALGVLATVKDARLSFDDEAVPLLRVTGRDESDPWPVAEEVVTSLVERTHPDRFVLEDAPTLRSTTPSRSALNPLAERSWDDPAVDEVLRAFSLGSTKEVKPGQIADPQVVAASLLLISGRSYPRKSAADLWPAPPRKADPQAYHVKQRHLWHHDVVGLLEGRRPRTVSDSMFFRFSQTDVSPRLTAGLETTAGAPLVEALAFVGLTQLLPRQRDPSTGRDGMRWGLNPLPLTLAAIVDLHETGLHPRDWSRFTCRVGPVGGGTKASCFSQIQPRTEDA